MYMYIVVCFKFKLAILIHCLHSKCVAIATSSSSSLVTTTTAVCITTTTCAVWPTSSKVMSNGKLLILLYCTYAMHYLKLMTGDGVNYPSVNTSTKLQELYFYPSMSMIYMSLHIHIIHIKFLIYNS